MKRFMCRRCAQRRAYFKWRDSRGIIHFGRGKSHDLCPQCFESAMRSTNVRMAARSVAGI
jgi:hypothetical protein